MGQFLGKFCDKSTNQLEEINLLKMENDNFKKKIQSLQKYSNVLKEELDEIKKNYNAIIIKLSEIIE